MESYASDFHNTMESCHMGQRRTNHVSQCSTFVRNTVVRAIVQAYGKWWISTPWRAETTEPIEMKLGTGDYVGGPTPHA